MSCVKNFVAFNGANIAAQIAAEALKIRARRRAV